MPIFSKKGVLKRKKRNHFVKIIVKSNKQLLAIINDIIDISKIKSGQVDLVYVRFAVDEIIEGLHGFYKPLCVEK